MKIGIDLDGVIFDSEKDYRVYSELYDLLDLHKNSKKDNREIKFQQRLDLGQVFRHIFLRIFINYFSIAGE